MCMERCTRVRKGVQGCADVCKRCAKGVQRCTRVREGAQMCMKRCAIVHKRCARCAQVRKRCRRVRKCAQIVAPGDSIVGRWSGWCECRPSAQGSENSGIFEYVPVLTGLTAKNQLRVDWGGCGGGGTRPGGG